jgi:hypothetical protein
MAITNPSTVYFTVFMLPSSYLGIEADGVIGARLGWFRPGISL